MTIDIDPMLVHLGPIAITWYGLFVAIAVLTGTWLATREARRRGVGAGHVETLVFWVLGGGIVGARLLHVIDKWDYYSSNAGAILAIQNGGLAIGGAVLGGIAAGSFYAWHAGLPLRQLSDAAAPGALLGQAIGRIGCLFTGDAVGRATDGFGVTYLNPGAMVPQLGVRYEPVFLYEMAWDLAVLALVWPLRRRLRTDGQLFGLYLLLYGIGKFVLTYLRTEVVWIGGLQEAQLVAAVLVALGLGWIIWPSVARSGPRPQPLPREVIG